MRYGHVLRDALSFYGYETLPLEKYIHDSMFFFVKRGEINIVFDMDN